MKWVKYKVQIDASDLRSLEKLAEARRTKKKSVLRYDRDAGSSFICYTTTCSYGDKRVSSGVPQLLVYRLSVQPDSCLCRYWHNSFIHRDNVRINVGLLLSKILLSLVIPIPH